MSGGAFNYDQYRIHDIAETIKEFINGNNDDSLDEFGDRRGKHYPPEIIEKFKEAAHTLRQASVMAQRVDWLVSGDDGEESFMRRWANEVPKYWPEIKRQFCKEAQDE
jgi:hypothetical protein